MVEEDASSDSPQNGSPKRGRRLTAGNYSATWDDAIGGRYEARKFRRRKKRRVVNVDLDSKLVDKVIYMQLNFNPTRTQTEAISMDLVERLLLKVQAILDRLLQLFRGSNSLCPVLQIAVDTTVEDES